VLLEGREQRVAAAPVQETHPAQMASNSPRFRKSAKAS
jgi:hypothetical protein